MYCPYCGKQLIEDEKVVIAGNGYWKDVHIYGHCPENDDMKVKWIQHDSGINECKMSWNSGFIIEEE